MKMKLIPKSFHFVFGLRPQTEPFHLMYYLCLASCIEVNKPDKVYFYYLNEPYGPWWDLIKPHLTLERVELNRFVAEFPYDSSCGIQHSYAHHADFIRLEKLLERGGVYADLDTLFVNELPEEFYNEQFVLGEELGQVIDGKYHGSLCNAWIMSAPNSEFGKKWLANMKEMFDGSWSAHSTLLPFKMSQQFPNLIRVEPERSFFKHRWTNQGIRELFEDLDEDLGGVYSFHLWSHLWWEKDRMDFSYFHHGLLTEEYVKYADTTYAHIARHFLPKTITPMRGVYKKQIRSARIEQVSLFLKHTSKRIQSKLKRETDA